MPNPRLDEEIYNDLFGLCTDPSTYMAFAMTHAADDPSREIEMISYLLWGGRPIRWLLDGVTALLAREDLLPASADKAQVWMNLRNQTFRADAFAPHGAATPGELIDLLLLLSAAKSQLNDIRQRHYADRNTTDAYFSRSRNIEVACTLLAACEAALQWNATAKPHTTKGKSNAQNH